MIDLIPVAAWDDVPQLETTTVAVAGPGGVMNKQAQSLLNRTEFLNEKLNALPKPSSGHGEVWLSDYQTLKDAIAALPAEGGVVMVPVGRYSAGTWNLTSDYMAKPNVTIRGMQMPSLSNNADRLEGGSVIYGRFIAYADNFTIENVGFDMGKYVTDTYYPSFDTKSSNHPDGGTWDAFVFAQPNIVSPLPTKRNIQARNVIGLMREPLSYGHAMQFEGAMGGFIDNAVGVFGVHSLVIKARDINVGHIAGYGASTNNVIIKSDTYASGGDLIIGSIDARKDIPGITPHINIPTTANGLNINAETALMYSQIQIGIVKALGMNNGILFTGQVGQYAPDIQIGLAQINGYTGAMATAIKSGPGKFPRIQFGTVEVSNAINMLDWNSGMSAADTANYKGAHLQMGQIVGLNVTGNAVKVSGNTRVKVDYLDLHNVGTVYYIDDTSRITVGEERLDTITTKWGRNPPALKSGWANYVAASNAPFGVNLRGHNVELTGLVKVSGTPSADIAFIPPYLLPTYDKRFPGYLNNTSSNTRSFVGIGVFPSRTGVTLNEATAPIANDWIPLDGINWKAGG